MRWEVWAPPVAVILVACYLIFSNPNAAFRSSDGHWADSEYQGKGRTFEVIVWNFERYKIDCMAPHAVLQRASPEIWYNVFAWPSYLIDRKWRVSYSDAHSEVGDYYPPSDATNCYNNGSSAAVISAASAHADRYLNSLK